MIRKMSFILKPKFLDGLLLRFIYHKLPFEILGFLNHILIGDVNVCPDSQYPRILDGLSEMNQ